MLVVDTGDGTINIVTFTQLWRRVWGAVSFAIYFLEHGMCRCRCHIDDCTFCVHECFLEGTP